MFQIITESRDEHKAACEVVREARGKLAHSSMSLPSFIAEG